MTVGHLMNRRGERGNGCLAILCHRQIMVMAAEDANKRREAIHQRQQTMTIFTGDRIHLGIAQRQRRVVHKDGSRLITGAEELGFQPFE